MENKLINSLGVVVSKPDQVLIVMRGISGAGKSTKAKSLVENGVIHSTDDLIEKTGDYNGFFSRMIASGDFSELSRMHYQNLKNAIESMNNGVTPVVIDNTNLRQNEPKAYVVAALEMGYADDNIKFVDIGTNGLSAEELAKRNAHGVPLEKIKAMINTYNSQGPLTIKTILNSKDMHKKSDVLYSAVVLSDASKNKLIDRFVLDIPNDWRVIAHHMTINMGELKDKTDVGKEVVLIVIKVGISDMAMAVQVEGYASKNAIPHITIAVSPEGKPVMSNDISNWVDIKPFYVTGFVTEVKKNQ